MRRRRLKPMPEPPEGMMFFFGRVVRVAVVEQMARGEMAKVDALPQRLRMLVKAFALDPVSLAAAAKEKGVDAVYAAALKKNRKLIVKPRKRSGT